MKILASNKKAYFEYAISEVYEAGIVLLGSEVKSVKSNLVKLDGSYAIIRNNIVSLLNCHITKYPLSYYGSQIDPVRTRILLFCKKEIRKLVGKVQQRGYTLIPLKIYINNKGFIKLELGLAKHKKLHEKKEIIKERDLKKQANREIKERY